jgi:hypothetical protein
VPTAVDLARQQWQEAYRVVEESAGEPADYERLLEQVGVVTEELRRRIGRVFTLAELVDLYAGSEHWSRDAIAERAPGPGWVRSASTASDAAFHLYARGARDYTP